MDAPSQITTESLVGTTTPPPASHFQRQQRKQQTLGGVMADEQDDNTSTIAPSLADKKRLKHREYVKKSYNKKIVRDAFPIHRRRLLSFARINVLNLSLCNIVYRTRSNRSRMNWIHSRSSTQRCSRPRALQRIRN